MTHPPIDLDEYEARAAAVFIEQWGLGIAEAQKAARQSAALAVDMELSDIPKLRTVDDWARVFMEADRRLRDEDGALKHLGVQAVP